MRPTSRSVRIGALIIVALVLALAWGACKRIPIWPGEPLTPQAQGMSTSPDASASH